jgi:multiple sugar transport system permease protein
MRGSSESRAAALFCTPAFLLLGFSVVLPFLVAVGITFTNQRLLSPNPTAWVGLENYVRLLAIDVVTLDDAASLRDVLRADDAYRGFKELTRFGWGEKQTVVVARDPLFWRSLRNTFGFAFLVIPLQCGTALGLAMLVNRSFWARTLFRTGFFAPVVTSMVVVAIVWSFLYNDSIGLLNQLLRSLSGGWLEGIDWIGDERFALIAVVIMSAWQGAGFQMLIFLSGLQSIPSSLYEASMLDGASGWQRFWYVTLPGLKNTTIFVVVSTTIAAFALFTQVDVMTRGGPNDATSTLIHQAVRAGFREQDVSYGSTIAVVFFVLVLAVALLQKRITQDDAEA